MQGHSESLTFSVVSNRPHLRHPSRIPAPIIEYKLSLLLRSEDPYFNIKIINFTNKKPVLFLVGFLILSSAFAAWLDKTERKWYGVKPGVYLEDQLVGGFLPQELDIVTDELAARFRTIPCNPLLNRETGEIIPEIKGFEIDLKKTKKNVMLAPPNSRLKISLIEIAPAHYASELEALTNVVGAYSTWFYGSAERHQNITLALQSLNNIIVWQGETLSFNQVVGPRTPERGYLMAPIIGGEGIGFGGGVCQVSTTLYNAVLSADLEIVQRRPHSKRVPYVPEGRDAAVVYGAQDMAFRNNTDHPIIIKSGINRGRITVRILGK